jgi:heme/copper-type cytochrome/quinol oxidase subunit 4
MSTLRTFKNLKSEGKLHKRLLFQIRILSVISLILLGVVVYQIIVNGLNVWISAGIAVVSFFLGLFVFSKMNKMVWNEEEEVIQTGRMEIAGVAVIVLYIAFEMGLRTFLNAEFAGTFAATAYLLAGIGASLLGRSLGTLVAIQKLTKDTSNPL